MRELLSSDYFPYGSQYYRAPSPGPDDWDRDLDRMKELGFNSIKYWAQWRWNHPAENEFYWDDLDRLMDLAQKHGLRVMLNTIVDVAPAWIYTKYPDASMLTLSGRRIGPQTQPHRQIGGLGVCLNHREVMDHMFRFLEACIERYSEHPALEIWNVGSEPELTQSMAEMRKWADDAQKMGDMLCFCDHCATAFRGWLKRKYGRIEALNLAWNRNYRSFDEAELPKTRNTFNDIVDWRMFFVHTLGENVKRRFDVAEKGDAGRHPLMCHHVFIQGFPVTSTASDPWNIGQTGDLHGFTQMDDPMMHDILRSCARGKPVMSAEMLMLMGYTLDLPNAIDANDIKRHIFTGIAANLKGFLFWQYRPEMLGREAPTWGLSHLDGSTTPWLEAFGEVGSALQDHTDFLFDAKPRDAEVAILYSPENQIFAWASTGNEKTATDSLLGAHRALYERSYPIDFLHPKDFETGEVLDQYRVIIVPFPYFLSEEICARLSDWVAAGGTLIGEAYFGGWHKEEGRHHTTIPGYGLDKVFGVRQKNAEPASEHGFLAVSGVVREGTSVSVQRGVNQRALDEGFIAGEPFDASGGLGSVDIRIARSLPPLREGDLVRGLVTKETFVVEGAEVLAEYADGQPAVVMNSHGKGRAILIGSYVALPYQRHGFQNDGALFAALVGMDHSLYHPRVAGDLRVRVDVVETGDSAMLVVQNLEGRPVEAVVSLPDFEARSMDELFGGEAVEMTATASGATFTLHLDVNEVRVYRG
jgi:beta-galactosidase